MLSHRLFIWFLINWTCHISIPMCFSRIVHVVYIFDNQGFTIHSSPLGVDRKPLASEDVGKQNHFLIGYKEREIIIITISLINCHSQFISKD